MPSDEDDDDDDDYHTIGLSGDDDDDGVDGDPSSFGAPKTTANSVRRELAA